MACRWRIRHKLVLGLGLVVGIIVLLLGGTLEGVLQYRSAMNSIASKVLEESKAEAFHNEVNQLGIDDKSGSGDEEGRLRERIRLAREKLDAYHTQLDETVKRGRDDKNGFDEYQAIQALSGQFDELDKALDDERKQAKVGNDPTVTLLEKKEIKGSIQKLGLTASDLHTRIYDHIHDVLDEGKHYYQECLWIVGTTSVCGILLMAGLLRFFYGWLFYPIRDLETGAERVAQGDFDHRIDVHSGDEMEELADAFNNMTSRLQEMYRDLAHQVNERSRQLVRSERLASVGFLAAGVAHEINNPLASIAFCSEALEGRIADVVTHSSQDGEVITKYLKMIQQEAFRCKAITQRLLEFSRSGERRREPTDLRELIQSVLDVVQHLQNSKGKKIVFEPAGAVEAWINAQEVKSVVLNLVVNALDSMDENGKLTITLKQRDRMAELVFADTGCGMTEEILENIFEPFFTRSRTGKGTGLGLSISHRVITQHGGEIEASSAGPNQGSTFTVRLPLQPAEEQAVGTKGQGSTKNEQALAIRLQESEGQSHEPDDEQHSVPLPKRKAA